MLDFAKNITLSKVHLANARVALGAAHGITKVRDGIMEIGRKEMQKSIEYLEKAGEVINLECPLC